MPLKPTDTYVCKFSPNQKLPPNYLVVIFEGSEHYQWFNEKTEEEGLCHWDRFRARRDAWAHYEATKQ